MGIVRMNRTCKVCGTCALWDGPRETAEDCFVFNNRDSGACGGSSFTGWQMSAVSTCLHWERSRHTRAGATENGPKASRT